MTQTLTDAELLRNTRKDDSARATTEMALIQTIKNQFPISHTFYEDPKSGASQVEKDLKKHFGSAEPMEKSALIPKHPPKKVARNLHQTLKQLRQDKPIDQKALAETLSTEMHGDTTNLQKQIAILSEQVPKRVKCSSPMNTSFANARRDNQQMLDTFKPLQAYFDHVKSRAYLKQHLVTLEHPESAAYFADLMLQVLIKHQPKTYTDFIQRLNQLQMSLACIDDITPEEHTNHINAYCNERRHLLQSFSHEMKSLRRTSPFEKLNMFLAYATDFKLMPYPKAESTDVCYFSGKPGNVTHLLLINLEEACMGSVKDIDKRINTVVGGIKIMSRTKVSLYLDQKMFSPAVIPKLSNWINFERYIFEQWQQKKLNTDTGVVAVTKLYYPLQFACVKAFETLMRKLKPTK